MARYNPIAIVKIALDISREIVYTKISPKERKMFSLSLISNYMTLHTCERSDKGFNRIGGSCSNGIGF